MSHETFHIRNTEYETPWMQAFNWYYCADYPNDWEKTQDNILAWRNKRTGIVIPNPRFTTDPSGIPTPYGKLNWDDDYADSCVYALYAAEQLKRLSQKRFEAIKDIRTIKKSPVTS